MKKSAKLTGMEELLFRIKKKKILALKFGVSEAAVFKWFKQGYAPKGRVKELSEMYGIHESRLCDQKLLTKKKNSK